MGLSLMSWNWQQKDWPDFRFEKSALDALEAQFLRQSGLLMGAYRHISDDDKLSFAVDLMSNEALKTSEIEGEYLNRDSLRSSIRQHFGLQADARRISPAERGIADMMIDLHRHFAEELSHETLFAWHSMIASSREDLIDIGRYRTNRDDDPMQVVSGPVHRRKVHFEAPPSSVMQKEMGAFITWFNKTAPQMPSALTALTRAGIAHLYFVSIHPFEDGNGRIGRGISEKVLSQSLGQPALIALSQSIEKNKKRYYGMLEESNKDNEITAWLIYFAETVLDAQNYTQAMVDFLIKKTKLYDKVRGQLNERQDKALARMFREGVDGFKGGLSAENYITITGTSRATATRDLQDLVELGVLTKTGERKGTRYWLRMA